MRASRRCGLTGACLSPADPSPGKPWGQNALYSSTPSIGALSRGASGRVGLGAGASLDQDEPGVTDAARDMKVLRSSPRGPPFYVTLTQAEQPGSGAHLTPKSSGSGSPSRGLLGGRGRLRGGLCRVARRPWGGRVLQGESGEGGALLAQLSYGLGRVGPRLGLSKP